MNEWRTERDTQDSGKKGYVNLDEILKYSTLARSFQGSSMIDIITHQLPIVNLAKVMIENKKIPELFAYQNYMIEELVTDIRIFCVYVDDIEMDYQTPDVGATEYYLYLFDILAERLSIKRTIDAFFTLVYRLDKSIFEMFKQSQKYLNINFKFHDDSDRFRETIGKHNAAGNKIRNHQSFVPMLRLYYMALVKQLNTANQSWLNKRKERVLRNFDFILRVEKEMLLRVAPRNIDSWNSIYGWFSINEGIKYEILRCLIKQRNRSNCNIGGSIFEICKFIGSSETSHIPIILTVFDSMMSADKTLLLRFYPAVADLLTYREHLKDDVLHAKYLLTSDSYRTIDRSTLILAYGFCVGFLENVQVSIRNLKLGNHPGCENARDKGREIGADYVPRKNLHA